LKTFPKLDFPEVDLKLKHADGQTYVFDQIRKKWLLLTPEEWVRQHLVNYLVAFKKYPASLISLESGLKYNTLNKRSDVLVYDKNSKPFLLAECKSTEIAINQKVIEQVSMYNTSIKATNLLVTNGLKHYCWTYNTTLNKFELLQQIPEFITILNH
jgi:hypothetical protein